MRFIGFVEALADTLFPPFAERVAAITGCGFW